MIIAISVEHQLVTDRHTITAYTALAWHHTERNKKKQLDLSAILRKFMSVKTKETSQHQKNVSVTTRTAQMTDHSEGHQQP